MGIKTPQVGQQSGEPSREHKRILIVAASPSSLDALRAVLQPWSYSAEYTRDSWQTIRKMNEGRLDVAVIALDLPPVGGVALSAWDLELSARRSTQEVPPLLSKKRTQKS